MQHHTHRNFTELSYLTASLILSPLLDVSNSKTVLYHNNHILKVYNSAAVTNNSAQGFQLCIWNFKIGGNIEKCSPGNFASVLVGCTTAVHVARKSIQSKPYVLGFRNPCSTLANETFLNGIVCSTTVKTENKKSAVSGGFSIVESVNCDGNNFDTGLLNDLVIDCYPSGKDEPVLQNLMMFNIKRQCADADQLPCMYGHNKCFNVSLICTYRTNRLGHIFPCRNGAHLKSCEFFQCNMEYKCHENCIPWQYVCDKKWDCPAGEDEAEYCEVEYMCKGGFKCKFVPGTCIHLGQLCDEIQDCLYGDDEELCDLHSTCCPTDCHCFMFTLRCNQNFIKQQKTLPYKYATLSNTHSNRKILHLLLHLSVLKISNTTIREICFLKLTRIQLFVATFNDLQQIERCCFQLSFQMNNLNLVSDQIGSLLPKVFAHLPFLKILNLSHNCFPYLPKTAFYKLNNIEVLALLGITLSHTDAEVFDLPKLGIVEAVQAHICCVVPLHTKCSSVQASERNVKAFSPICH